MTFEEKRLSVAIKTEARLAELCRYKSELPEKNLGAAICYSLLGGGKRLRAYLVHEFCTLLGGSEENALDYGCAVEMIHAFSLIHDDLPAMDDDDMRRGKPSCHKAFDEPTAILAGDALALDAFSVIAKNRFCSAGQNLLATLALSESAGSKGMTAGQQIDLDFENAKTDLDTVLRLIDKKTGALISCACRLGAVAAGAKKEDIERAQKFGLYVGRAFQITDDLLDLKGNSEKVGKTLGKDEKDGKSTVASIVGTERAYELAQEYISKAKNAISDLESNESKQNLYCFCDYIPGRSS